MNLDTISFIRGNILFSKLYSPLFKGDSYEFEITLLPVFQNAHTLFCVVPGKRKKKAQDNFDTIIKHLSTAGISYNASITIAYSADKVLAISSSESAISDPENALWFDMTRKITPKSSPKAWKNLKFNKEH